MQKHLSYFKFLGAIIYYFLIMYVIAPYVVNPFLSMFFNIEFYVQTNLYNSTYVGLINASAQMLSYGLLGIGLLLILKNEFYILFSYSDDAKSRALKQAGIGFLIYYAVNFCVNTLVLIAQNILGQSFISQNQAGIENVMASGGIPLLIMIFTVILVGPFVEEFIFRKSFFSIIKNKYVALVVSSLVFALMHTIGYGYDFINLVFITLPYLAAGFVFGYVYIKSDQDILASSTLHIMLNLLSVLLILFL